MSGSLLRLVCTAAVAATTVLAPAPATASPEPESDLGQDRPQSAAVVSDLLTNLQQLYRKAEQATEAYNATEEKLKKQRAETDRLDRALARTRLSLHDSRGAAGRLARQQYQSSTGISPYVRLLLARDPQHAIDQGRVIGRLARERAGTVGRLTGDERKARDLARKARKALDDQLSLTERRKKERDEVRERLHDVEEMLASLSRDQLTALAEFERKGVAKAQQKFIASGALSSVTNGDDGKNPGNGSGIRTPSAEGDRALRHAVRQLGKPYEWGAEGPTSYDCSGLTSQAWAEAGTPIPRTSQEQWKRLKRIPLPELRPGDLVVYFPEATHVALYLGDGMVVQAPRPGAKVKVSPIAANPVLGAVRPDPDGKPLRRYEPPELPEGATDGSDEGYEGSPVHANSADTTDTDTADRTDYAAPAPDTSTR
ncbi:cell wall-associated NlpC family hydrolase [Streptomyces africanus]|uniref:Cell wall-associated NlpC family hydrolase n=1 Tax=Streptomyces africanus TaxID=231024 RepID=A0ABU0QV28_9ACTN|nr:C40 family peptidase [Streptomyces africanus]MDQ0751267.1 cell wall-associated NlpC family hydrolase [Streptomyces africanus]